MMVLSHPEFRALTVAMALILNGAPVSVTVRNDTLEILPDEVEVRAEARSGLVVASEGAYLAVLQTELTPELVREGLARSFVRRVQDLRKQSDFDIADRINMQVSASPDLEQAIKEHQDYIMGETLTLELQFAEPVGEEAIGEFEFDAERVKVGLVKAN